MVANGGGRPPTTDVLRLPQAIGAEAAGVASSQDRVTGTAASSSGRSGSSALLGGSAARQAGSAPGGGWAGQRSSQPRSSVAASGAVRGQRSALSGTRSPSSSPRATALA